MAPKKTQPDHSRLDQLVAATHKDRDARELGYREQALKLFPHVCGRCTRDFSGKSLRELTVHHKDHDHDNNPTDGSNWELLCIYCHENEHARHATAAAYGEVRPDMPSPSSTGNRPFADLAALLEKRKK